jgi:hypothetical protein
MNPPPGHGDDGRRLVVPSAFADDDGAQPPALRAALLLYSQNPAAHSDVIRALVSARLLVPVVAVLDESETTLDAHGRKVEVDKSSHMATVSLVQADGRRGLLAFTSVETMARWDAQARPVPAAARDVAAAAREEGAQGVLIDIAGPVRFALDGDHLTWLSELGR